MQEGGCNETEKAEQIMAEIDQTPSEESEETRLLREQELDCTI